ncbi:MAG: hypothetical protein WKF30_14655 [Pyrinomonadaceae bacterium]
MQLIIRRIREQGRDVRSFDMMPEEAAGRHGLTFTPGQVAVLSVADLQGAYFAFASAPEDAELEFLIKRSGEAGRALYDLQIGQSVELTHIVGRGFSLDDYHGRDLIFIAMGTGVAPLRSALRSALNKADKFGRMIVLYGVRTPEDFCYRDEVEHWQTSGVEMRQVISQPTGYEWSGQTGYVQSLLDNLLPQLRSPVALVCGSPEMIDQTRSRLQEMGLAPEQILTNY